jgi:uridine kinase
MLDKIIKRDGRLVPFDRHKITTAIMQAAIAVGGRDRPTAEKVTDDVLARLNEQAAREGGDEAYPTVEEIQDLVEKALIKRGHARTAKAYILYRYEHALKRAGKESLTYSGDNIPYKKLWKALAWAVDTRCVTMADLNEVIRRGEYPELISAAEDFYNAELDEVMAELLKQITELKVIIVTGPSSSGKTTTTLKLKEKLEQAGYALFVLCADNYFFNLKDQLQDSSGDFDYETPQSLDLTLINQHLKDFIAGKAVEVPFYNFKTGRREGRLPSATLKKNEIILIDSLHGMYKEMTAGIPKESIFKVYIETLSQIKDKNNKFVRWADIRLLRRMIRDSHYRNYNPEQTIAHWHYVRRSELRYIIPQLKEAFVIVNSYLAYELPIMKHLLAGAITRVINDFQDKPGQEDAWQRALRINDLFKELQAWDDLSLVPDSSLLREFIGGGRYKY